MPIDASIYGQLRPAAFDPMQQYMTMAQLSAMNRQGEVDDFKLDTARRAEQDRLTMRNLAGAAVTHTDTGEVNDGGFDTKRVPSGFDLKKYEQSLYGAGFVNEGAAVAKSRAEQEKDRAELLTKDRTNFIAFADEARKQLPLLKDDASLAAFKQEQMRRASMFSTPEIKDLAMRAAQGIPDRYDPAWVRNQVISADKLFTPNPTKRSDGQREWFEDTNPFTNPSVLTQQPVQMQPTPGENLVSERAKEANKTAAGRRDDDAVTAIRSRYEDVPEVKNYRAVVPIFNSAVNAPDTRAGDIQFAYTIGKIFDPNSVVREGELKLVGEAATVMQKYLGELRTLTEGKGRLTPQTRRELLETARARAVELQNAEQAARKPYAEQAAARNLPAHQIFGDMPKLADIPGARKGSPSDVRRSENDYSRLWR